MSLFALGFVLFISGFFLMVLTVTLTDEDNNTVEIYSKGKDIQFIVDNQYPLAEKIRVKTLFVYKDIYLIHLDQATNTGQTVTN